MRLTESRLRQIIRRAIFERMGTPPVSYLGTPELQLLQDAYGDPDLAPEDVRHLAFRLRVGRVERLEIMDAVIHSRTAPLVIDAARARAAGTDLVSLLDMLEALGAQRV